MSSEESARHLRRLLSELKASEELEKLSARRRDAHRRTAAVRAEELHAERVFPSLRAFAAELERQGHQTRIERIDPRHSRLHVQLQGRRLVNAAVEVDWRLEGEPQLRARIRHHYRDLADEQLPASAVDAEHLAGFWVRILERLVALAVR